MSNEILPSSTAADGRPDGDPVVIREARSADQAALRLLAERDSSPVPAEPLIVAEVAGELRAAVSVSDGHAIADPFHATAELAALAEMRAGQLRSASRRRARIVARTAGPPTTLVRGTA